jgi:hypothetical protein
MTLIELPVKDIAEIHPGDFAVFRSLIMTGLVTFSVEQSHSFLSIARQLGNNELI